MSAAEQYSQFLERVRTISLSSKRKKRSIAEVSGFDDEAEMNLSNWAQRSKRLKNDNLKIESEEVRREKTVKWLAENVFATSAKSLKKKDRGDTFRPCRRPKATMG